MIDIPALYERFFELGGPKTKAEREAPWRHRRKCTSLRLPGCLLLADLVRQRRPRRVLDLGSGLTSHVLRALEAEVPGMVVVTTDTAEAWLSITYRELQRDGLDTRFMMMQQHFEATPFEPFDLISVDISNTLYRVELAPHFLAWLAGGGIIFLDDWRMEPAATRMREVLEGLGFAVTEHVDTLDDFGQTTATAERRMRP